MQLSRFRSGTGRGESRRDGGPEEEVGMGVEMEMVVTMSRGVGKEREMESAGRKGMERSARRLVERERRDGRRME